MRPFYRLLLPLLMAPLFAWAAPFDLEGTLAALKPGTPGTVRIPAGIYRLSAQGLALKNLTGVTLEGEAPGVTLLSTHYERPALTIDGCRDLTLRNLTLDCDPLPFTQGTVTGLDPAARTFTFSVHAGYPGLTAPYLSGSTFHLFAGDQPRWKDNAPDFYGIRVERLVDDTRGLIRFGPQTGGFEHVAVGDRVVVPVKRSLAIRLTQSAGVTMEDVTIHSAAGAAVLVRFCEEAGRYTRLRVVPGPPPAGATEPRLLSTCADAFNVAYTRRGPVLDRCEFSHQGDDSVNLHGVVLPVLKWFDDRTYLSMRPQKNEPFEKLLRAGDTVRFLLEPAYEVAASAQIASIERTGESFDDWAPQARALWTTFSPKSLSFYRITLDRPLSGLPAGAWTEIPASSAPGCVIRDSHFHDHRARGLRLMTEDGLIERNRFERIKGVAISIGPEFAFWREAGWARGIVIRGNTLTDIGQGANLRQPDSYTTGAISVISNLRVGSPGAPAAHFPGNENILIEDNLIDGCSLDGISVCAARGVRIAGNTIRNVNRHPAGDAGRLFRLNTGRPISMTDADVSLGANLLP